MIQAEQIPNEVVEAGAKEITMALVLAVEEDCCALALTNDERKELARAAIAAALSAWPDRHLHEWQRPWLGGMSGTDIILPLPQEPRDE